MRNLVKEHRLKKKISQVDLAKTCEVSRQTIHAIEVDKYTPSVELALKISKALGKKTETLFLLEEE